MTKKSLNVPPPLAILGDLDPDLTYMGIGRVTSEWERVEFAFARIYSACVGDPDGSSMGE